METKVRNPHTDKLITIGGKTYNDLIKEGYTRADLIDYTNNPKPIFVKPKENHESLKAKFFNNPKVDPRNPNKRIYKNKTPFRKLVAEFGDPYKINTNDIKSNIKYDDIKYNDNAILLVLKYLSPEDIFSIYVTNKDFQQEINQYYNEKEKQSFIVWLRKHLKEEYEKQFSELEKERELKNEEIKKLRMEEIRKRKQYEEEQLLEELEMAKQRAEAERIRKEIEADEILLQRRYQQEQQFFNRNKNTYILRQLGINDRNAWRRWIIANHPDKGGNSQYYALVMEEGRRIGY